MSRALNLLSYGPSDFACPGAVVQIVSQAEAQGEVAVQELADIQGQTFDSARVLVSNKIGGMEDIPVSLPAIRQSKAASICNNINAVALLVIGSIT